MRTSSPSAAAPSPSPATSVPAPRADRRSIVAVVVTHRRRELLARSLAVVCGQTHPVDHVIVIDNAAEDTVRKLVESMATERTQTTYLGSRHNLGGAGGFALGMLHALALGADLVWCADDDGRPEDEHVLTTLLDCLDEHGLAEVSPMVCDIAEPDTFAFPVRQGTRWLRHRSELQEEASGRSGATGESAETLPFLPSYASLMNGALFTAECLDRVGVPDLRLFIRGDEVELHRRLARSGLPYGTCLACSYLHPNGSGEFRPILGGRMHAQYPDDDAKRFFTYRNRGYLMNQPGMRRLLPQEYARFAWFFLVQQHDPRGFVRWLRLHALGRREHFPRPQSGGS